MVFFLTGNRIRIRTEEQLLRETFGDQFDETRGASRLSSRSPGDDPAMMATDNFLSCWKNAIVNANFSRKRAP